MSDTTVSLEGGAGPSDATASLADETGGVSAEDGGVLRVAQALDGLLQQPSGTDTHVNGSLEPAGAQNDPQQNDPAGQQLSWQSWPARLLESVRTGNALASSMNSRK